MGKRGGSVKNERVEKALMAAIQKYAGDDSPSLIGSRCGIRWMGSRRWLMT